MATLGDSFPEEEKRKFIEKSLIPGQVLYLFSTFTTPPKEKFLLLSCTDPTPLVFIINSSIHPFIEKKKHLLECQVTLPASKYGFLDHTSYIDCSKVIPIDKQVIVDQLLPDLGRIKGIINKSTQDKVIKTVNRARTISLAHKKLILPGFGGLISS